MTSTRSNKQLTLIPIVLIALVIILDQITKIWAVNTLTNSAPIKVIGDFFMFSLVYNEGGAMGTNFGSSIYYLISSSLILLFVLYYIYMNRKHLIVSIPLSCIAGGALGNLIDRISYGKVVDFIDIDFFDIDLFGYTLQRWWTFNIADSAISVSIVFLLYLIFKKKMPGMSEEEVDNIVSNDVVD